MSLLALLDIPYILLKLRNWRGVATVAGLLAVWWAVATGREKWRKYRTRGWPTAEGAVSNIVVKKVDGGANGVDYWKLTFDYTYRVSAEHTGSYSFNLVTEKLRDRAEAGMVGKVVCVRYDPKDEAKSVLWFDEVWDLW
jgi:hypothetical protein